MVLWSISKSTQVDEKLKFPFWELKLLIFSSHNLSTPMHEVNEHYSMLYLFFRCSRYNIHATWAPHHRKWQVATCHVTLFGCRVGETRVTSDRWTIESLPFFKYDVLFPNGIYPTKAAVCTLTFTHWSFHRMHAPSLVQHNLHSLIRFALWPCSRDAYIQGHIPVAVVPNASMFLPYYFG